MTDEEYLLYLSRDCHYVAPKVLPGGTRWAAVAPMIVTYAIVTGQMGDEIGYDNRWCYNRLVDAMMALNVWDGSGEPPGWHRHPGSGRRIARTVGEIDNDGRVVPIGEEYVRW